VLLHGFSVDLALIEASVARGAQGDQVLEGVLTYLPPRLDVRDLGGPYAACWDRAAMTRFNKNGALDLCGDGGTTLWHVPRLEHTPDIDSRFAADAELRR
ncbi:hypothetical protein ACWDU9_32295, partial [Streptomyces cellulosae]